MLVFLQLLFLILWEIQGKVQRGKSGLRQGNRKLLSRWERLSSTGSSHTWLLGNWITALIAYRQQSNTKVKDAAQRQTSWRDSAHKEVQKRSIRFAAPDTTGLETRKSKQLFHHHLVKWQRGCEGLLQKLASLPPTTGLRVVENILMSAQKQGI